MKKAHVVVFRFRAAKRTGGHAPLTMQMGLMGAAPHPMSLGNLCWWSLRPWVLCLGEIDYVTLWAHFRCKARHMVFFSIWTKGWSQGS